MLSNLTFAVVGAAGLLAVLRPRTSFRSTAERWPYFVFALGVLLTAAGSCYYHLAPNNETLFWDRLPMTISFMSLISAQIVDRVDVRAGLLALVPMLLIGAGTVVYWIVTERQGRGNVVPYAVLQAYAVIVLLKLALMHPSRYTHGNAIYAVFAGYLLAKGFEHFDRQIFELTGVSAATRSSTSRPGWPDCPWWPSWAPPAGGARHGGHDRGTGLDPAYPLELAAATQRRGLWARWWSQPEASLRRRGDGKEKQAGAFPQVGGALAVAVRDDVDAILGGPAHRAYHVIRGGCGVARVARRVVAERLVVRPVAPGGQALRTAVDGELCAGDAHPLHVGAAHAGLDELAIDEDVGIDRHIGALC